MHNYLKKIFRSKSRTILTLSGLVLSVFILVFVLAITETAFDKAMYVVNTYKACNGVVITGTIDYEDYKNIANNDMYKTRFEIVEHLSVRLKELTGIKDNNISVYGRAIQVDGNFNLNLISVDTYSNERYKSVLLCGRLINQSDIDNENKVILIDESLAKILFGKVDVVGEKVKIRANRMDGSVVFSNYSIVGVFESSAKSKEEYEQLLKALEDETSEYVESNFCFYIPYTAAYNTYDGENGSMNIVCESDSENYKTISNDIRMLNLSNGSSIIDADIIYDDIASRIEESRNTMIYAMFFVFTISGLCIMNTMMFSVKERINEIGIRKAIGAFNSDIITQFLFEGFIYGIISGVLGVIISSWILSIGFLVLKDNFIGVDKIVISFESIGLAVTISILVSIIASLIPAIYASRIKISDALKFD